jgi:hypothetical protein
MEDGVVRVGLVSGDAIGNNWFEHRLAPMSHGECAQLLGFLRRKCGGCRWCDATAGSSTGLMKRTRAETEVGTNDDHLWKALSGFGEKQKEAKDAKEKESLACVKK